MISIRRVLLGAFSLAVAFAAVATPASAQVELGWDAALAISSISDCDGCDNLTTISFPTGSFRAGFFMSPTIELEPSVSLTLLSGGGETVTVISLDTDLLYHFSEDATKSRFYLAVGPGILLASGGGESVSAFSLGAKLGVKLPASDQLSFRVAGTYDRGFENEGDGIPGTNSFGVLFGMSVMVGE